MTSSEAQSSGQGVKRGGQRGVGRLVLLTVLGALAFGVILAMCAKAVYPEASVAADTAPTVQAER